jgi:peptidoglycan/LPS O-acetylase OafA/YrhL
LVNSCNGGAILKSLNTTSYYTRIDHLRIYAAFLVMLYHGLSFGAKGLPKSEDFFARWVENGSIGVTLFLVLSGFLFTLICKSGEYEIEYGKFIYNRFLRIFPLLIVIFFLLLTVERSDMQGIDIFNLLFLQLNVGNPVTGYGGDVLPIGSIWTIAVEFQFYLLFPFLIIFYNKYNYKYFLGLISVIIGFRFVLWNIQPNIYFNFYHTITGRLDQFLIGILLGIYYLKRQKILMKNPLWLVVILLGFTYLLQFDDKNMYKGVLGFTVEGILWGLVILAYLDMNIPIPKLLDKGIAKLGELSFSLYLLHLLVFALMQKLLGVVDFVDSAKINAGLNTLFIGLPATILFSILTYNFIEKPFMEFRKPYLLKSKNGRKVA